MRATPKLATMLGLLAAALGCGLFAGSEESTKVTEAPTGEFVVSDVGRNAATTLATGLHVQELIRHGKTTEASRLLDSTYLLQIALLREFDNELIEDERHIRLRNEVVKKLKRTWLADPPEYLDQASASFIEKTCMSIPGCPPRKITARKPLPKGP